ncbi:MAG: two-component regulator propeller domain-containing protein, partial [Bacteroidota bacterium]
MGIKYKMSLGLIALVFFSELSYSCKGKINSQKKTESSVKRNISSIAVLKFDAKSSCERGQVKTESNVCSGFSTYTEKNSIPMAVKPSVVIASAPDTIIPGKKGVLMPAVWSCFFRSEVLLELPASVPSLPLRQPDNATTNLFNFDTEQGLGSSFVTSFCFDSNGFMWLGTAGSGVYRYDGNKLIQITEKDGLSNDVVYSVFQDNSGCFWFGGPNGKLSSYDGMHLRKYSLDTAASNKSNIFSIGQDHKGNLWFCTYGAGAFVYDGKICKQYTSSCGLNTNLVWSMFPDDQGNVWLGTEGEGAIKFDGQKFYKYTSKQGLSDDIVFSIRQDKSKQIWFSTYYGGATKFDGQKMTIYKVEQGLTSNAVYDVLQDAEGKYWFATYGGGVCILEGSHFTYLNKKNGLGSDLIWAVKEDNSSNVWIANYGGGMTKFVPHSFSDYRKNHGVFGGMIRTIFQDTKKRIWSGTYGGGVYCLDGKNTHHYTSKNGLMGNYIISVEEDKIGNMWFGDHFGKISFFDGNNFKNYSFSSDSIDFSINDILSDSYGNIWFSTAGNGLKIFDGKEFSYLTKKHGLKDNFITSMLEDSSGNIWMGTKESGIMKISSKDLKNRNFKAIKYINCSGQESWGQIYQLAQDQYGNLWAGTQKGLVCFNDTSWFAYSSDEGLNANKIKSIVIDYKNNIWCGTEKGLFIVELPHKDIQDLRKHFVKMPIIITYYSQENGLKSNEFDVRSGLSDFKNRIWMSNAKSVFTVDPPFPYLNKSKPVLYINSLFVNNKKFEFTTTTSKKSDQSGLNGLVGSYLENKTGLPLGLVLQSNQNNLKFDISAICWSSHQNQIRLQKKLLGFDNDWIDEVNKGSVEYNNLPPGDYQLLLRASKHSVDWSETIYFSFHISPPFWKTWWAYAFYVAAFISGLFSYIKWRERALKARQKQLEEKVDEATLLIRNQKDEVEKQKQKVQEKNTEILSSIEYAKRIQTAILPPPRVVKEFLKSSF